MSGERFPPVYPLTDFFRNPDRGFFRLSDDGRWLAFMEPVSFDDGPARMNLFVQALEGMVWALLALCYLYQRWSLPAWADKWLAQAGVLSFSLYVCHPFVILVLSPRVGVIPFTGSGLFNVVATGLLIMLPASLAVALMLNRLIEKPFLDFRRPYVQPKRLNEEAQHPPVPAAARESGS